MKTSLIVNPTITPPTGVLRVQALPKTEAVPAPHPLTDRFHAYACRVCNAAGTEAGTVIPAEQFVGHVADAVAEDAPRLPAAAKHAIDPDLTSGQLRVFNGQRDLLITLLDQRGDQAIPTVVSVLTVLAAQAPALDATIREEDDRRRRKLADQPRLPNLLTKREPK